MLFWNPGRVAPWDAGQGHAPWLWWDGPFQKEWHHFWAVGRVLTVMRVHLRGGKGRGGEG